MTRKRFEAVAAALRAVRPDVAAFAARDAMNAFVAANGQWLDAVASVADMATASVDWFDRARFERACGKEMAS